MAQERIKSLDNDRPSEHEREQRNDAATPTSTASTFHAPPPDGLTPRQRAMLHMQQTQGNAAVIRRLRQGTVQRDPPPNTTASSQPQNANNSNTGDPVNLAAAAYQQARAMIDAAPIEQLPTLRNDIAQAMERNNNASGIIFTLELGGQQFPNFPSHRLNDLFGATNVESRRHFDRTRANVQAQNRARALREQALQRRLATQAYLASLDHPTAALGPHNSHTDVYIIRNLQGQDIQVTRAQWERLRAQALPIIRLLLERASNYTVAAGEAQRWSDAVTISVGPPAVHSGGTYHPEDSAERQLALAEPGIHDNSLLERAFVDALEAVHLAQAADAAVLTESQNHPIAENTLVVLRTVRDTCIAIEGTLITVATGGIAGVVVGTTFGTVAGAAASAQDQYLQRGRIEWGPILTGVVINTVTGVIGARFGNAFSARAARSLTEILSTELAQRAVSTTIRDRITRSVVPTIVSTVVSRAGAAVGAGVNAAVNGADVERAFQDQVSLRAICLEVLTTSLGAVAHNLPRGGSTSAGEQTQAAAGNRGNGSPPLSEVSTVATTRPPTSEVPISTRERVTANGATEPTTIREGQTGLPGTQEGLRVRVVAAPGGRDRNTTSASAERPRLPIESIAHDAERPTDLAPHMNLYEYMRGPNHGSEATLYQNMVTRQYIVAQGDARSTILDPQRLQGLVGREAASGPWHAVRHAHPPERRGVFGWPANQLYPSTIARGRPGDFIDLYYEWVQTNVNNPAARTAVESIIDVTLQDGSPAETRFGIDPTSTRGAWWIQIPGPRNRTASRNPFRDLAQSGRSNAAEPPPRQYFRSLVDLHRYLSEHCPNHYTEEVPQGFEEPLPANLPALTPTSRGQSTNTPTNTSRNRPVNSTGSNTSSDRATQTDASSTFEPTNIPASTASHTVATVTARIHRLRSLVDELRRRSEALPHSNEDRAVRVQETQELLQQVERLEHDVTPNSSRNQAPISNEEAATILYPEVEQVERRASELQTHFAEQLSTSTAPIPTPPTPSSDVQIASSLGYTSRFSSNRVRDLFNSHEQEVFFDGHDYITRDIDQHNGGYWKKFNRRGMRVGTYNVDLTVRIRD